MNKQHHIIWNTTTQSWVAVSENTRARSKLSSKSVSAGTARSTSIKRAVLGCVVSSFGLLSVGAQAACSDWTAFTVPAGSAGAGQAGYETTCTNTTTGTYGGHGIRVYGGYNLRYIIAAGATLQTNGGAGKDAFSGYGNANGPLSPYTEIINYGTVQAMGAGAASGSQLNENVYQVQIYRNYGLFQGLWIGANPAALQYIEWDNEAGATIKGGLFGLGLAAPVVLVNNSGLIEGTNPQSDTTYSTYYTLDRNPFVKPTSKLALEMMGGASTLNQMGGEIRGDVLANSSSSTAINISGGVINGDLYLSGGTDAVNLTGGKINGNLYTQKGDDSFTASGGALIGNALMGDGNDVVTLTGSVDVTQAQQFDGGAGTDELNIDGMALRGFTAASNDGAGNDLAKGKNLTGWETINVKNAGSLKLSNSLFTEANVGELNIDATSTLDLKGNSPGVFKIFGNVNNSGAMTMADGAADDETTITGNYTGVAGSTYAIDTVLGDDDSATDRLVVNGNTSGETELLVTNVGGTGAQTINGINVVEVGGTSAEGNFKLAAPVQGGSYEYTLKRGSAIDDNDFYLVSKYAGTDCKIIGNCPIDIYRPAVANYVTAQSANADAGFTMLSTLHQRMGEQRGASTGLTTEKAQSWGRIFAGTKEAEGRTRFNYDSTVSGFQFGRDLMHKTDADGTQQRAGVTMQYANNSIDSVDTLRPIAGLDADTGHTNAVSIGLGGYYTHIANDGTYFDGVAQINHLQNTFHDAYDMRSRQKGWQLGLSGEFGKTVAHLGKWAVEPQAQLSYLYNNYSSFSDKYSNIDGFNAHNLRARLGVRLNKDELVNGKEAQYYGIVNLHHDLLKTKAVVLHDNNGTGTASVREKYDRTSWELGAGIQGRVGKATYLYADARYERSFKGNTSAAKVTMGVKSSF